MTAKSEDLPVSNGVRVTAEVRVRDLEEAETGYDLEQLVPRPTGRPLLGTGPAKALAVRFPPEQRAALQAQAEREGVHEAEIVREAVNAYLARPQAKPRLGSKI